MKSRTTLRLIAAFLLLGMGMQALPQTAADYYNRLFYLCKAWGHAKYFHTEIAKGTIKWDDQLITAIGRTKAAASDAEFNSALLLMLNSAGPMGSSTATLPAVPDELNNNLDHSWIDQPVYSAEVKAKLNEILAKFRPQGNYYVGQAFASGNPTFDTDSLYFTGANYPAEGVRLLALFRYWNIVNYFFPYKNLIDRNWDSVLAEFIPRMSEAADELQFHLALKEMTTRINDSHGGLSSPVYSNWAGAYSPPFLARFIENEMVITRVLPGITGLAEGDIIKEIDGQDAYQLRSDLRKYSFGSNVPAIERILTNVVLFAGLGPSTVTVSNGTATSTVSIERTADNYNNLKIKTSPIWKDTLIGGCSFGIVDMERLETTQVPAMFSDLWNTGAIIFDIRNYPLGTLWYLVNYLFPGPIHIADFTVPSITYPGSLEWKSTYIGSGTTNPYRGKVILLFDDRTQSQAEYTCMGLELFPDAIKIGSQTSGADGNVSKIWLTANSYTLMTGLGTFYGDRTPTQRVGIVPDYEVHPTIAGIRQGRDELMEFALNCALVNVHPGYCTSAGNASAEWISAVTIGSKSNSSGSSETIGHQDFLSTEFRAESGKSVALTLTPGFNRAAFENWCVWIDYNGDSGFDEPGELVFSKTRSKTAVSGTFTVPAGLSGTLRMRVSMSSSQVPGPCSMMSSGEVEDYVIIIVPPLPDPPVANFSADYVSPDVGTTVSFTDLSTGSPTGWQWSFPGGTPETSSVQNPLVTYHVPGSFSVILTVSRNGLVNTLTRTGYINVSDIYPGYCQPVGINSSADYIKCVSISGSLSNTTSGNGYTAYNLSTTLAAGSSYTVTLTPSNTSYRNYWKIWIDLNRDNDFEDAGECLLTVVNRKGSFSGPLVIPTSFAGPTRMRICMKSGAAALPCESGFTGEVEDYEITITNPGPVPVVPLPKSAVEIIQTDGILLYPNPSSGEAFLQISDPGGFDHYGIFDIQGRLIVERPLVSTVTEMDVRSLQKGIYFVRVTGIAGTQTKKFIRN